MTGADTMDYRDVLDHLDLDQLRVELSQVSESGDFGNSAALKELLEYGLLVGAGTEADVLAFEHGTLRNLCLKSIERSTERSAYSGRITSEFDLHQQAYKILEHCRKNGLPVAKIPMPIIALDDRDGRRQLLLMELVRGKTLWRIILEEIVNAHDEKDLGWNNKEELLSRGERLGPDLLNIFGISPDISGLDQLKVLLRRLKGKKFIKPEFFEAMKNSVRALNTAGFYHRDLHPRNVMLTEDAIWIIDFGHSKYDPKKLEGDPYEVSKFGTELSYSRDEGMLPFLEPFVDKTDDQLEEERQVLLDREARKTRRFIERMVVRQKSSIQDIVDSIDVEVDDSSVFVAQIAEERFLSSELSRAIQSGSLDKVIDYARIVVLLEFEKYATTKASREYFLELFSRRFPDPAIITNRFLQMIRMINPKDTD
ncbi:MAG: phosphotransferase [bacterium]|nr:phosphotransferase [bacterium]